MAVLTLDTTGFLQAINRLERRFDELTSFKTNRNVDEYLSQHDFADQRLYALASDVFGNGDWTAMICVAAASHDGDLIYECKRFMTESAASVREYGLATWLYSLIKTSAKTLYIKEPDDRISGTQPMDFSKMAAQCVRVGRCYGRKADCRRAVNVYDERMRWFVAYSILRWGENEPHNLDVASMLLTHPGLGMHMLRDGNTVMAPGALSDMRYRRVIDYLKYLRISADLDYARALADNSVPSVDGGRVSEFTAVDQRYVYDAKRLVEAYQSMWNDDKCVRRTGHEILADVERSGVRPNIPLWRNPVYLYDLTVSLVGPLLAGDLCGGFDRRDHERFDGAVEQLRDFEDFVREIGFVMLPVCAPCIYANYHLETVLDRLLQRGHYGKHARVGRATGALHGMQDAVSDTAADHGVMSSDTDVPGTVNNVNDCDDVRNLLVDVGVDMAVVAISRMPSETLARRVTTALIRCESSRYNNLVSELMDGLQISA